MRAKIDLTGERFTKLVVVELATSTQYNVHDRYWWCQCDCGSELKKIRQSHLKRKKIQSCGCEQFPLRSRSPYWKGCGEFSGTFFWTIKHGAKTRKLEFDITKKYIWELFLKQNRKCALTGIELQFASDWKTSNGTASLDRIDNSKGYIEGNVWWVHKDINQMKMDLTLSQFRDYCKKVSEISEREYSSLAQ